MCLQLTADVPQDHRPSPSVIDVGRADDLANQVCDRSRAIDEPAEGLLLTHPLSPIAGRFAGQPLESRGEGGLRKNSAEAIKSYRKAAELNHPSALERLKALKATPHDPAEVQKLLSDLGFDPGPRPGPKTGQAIRKFQQSRGLSVDGTASLRLVGQLRAAMKQKTAAATAKAAASAETPKRATPSPDLGSLKDLEKLDAPQ